MKGLEVMLTEQEVRKELLYRLVNPNLRKLFALYKQNGYELRIVGGAVRDILMNKKPKDIDLASDARPEQSLSMLQSAGIRTIETGLQHGTIIAHIDGEDYEITTLRVDVETDGRHAKVEYTNDWRLDAERRDLTFNAMSLDFEGNLYDYFGGFEDLKNGVARFVGDSSSRMQEDYLRILRYFRFQGRMESPNIDQDTLDNIRNNAPGLKQISGERIWMEMDKILGGSNTHYILTVMDNANVLDNIGLTNADLNELRWVCEHTHDSVLRLVSMLKNENEVQQLYAYWKFPKKVKELMDFIVVNRDIMITAETAQRLHAQYGVEMQHIMKLLEYKGMYHIIGELSRWETPEFPVGGRDLIQAGLRPGPEFQEILSRLKSIWAESGYRLSKYELLQKI